MAKPSFYRKSKYRNKKVTVDGINFDSKKEARRNQELICRTMAKEIRNVRRQVPFEVRINGKKIFNWFADFVYEEKLGDNWITIVEDVKSEITRKNPVYRLKKKAIEAYHGFVIKES